MSFSSWLNIVPRPTRDRHAVRKRKARPALESLEDRALLSTFQVLNLNDAGPGSLRQAIVNANATPGRDTITFSPGLAGTISLHGGLPSVTDHLDLVGPGAANLKVQRLSGPTESLLWVNQLVGVTLSGMTLANGNSYNGGAIHNSGTLEVNDCVFSENQSQWEGGAIQTNGRLRVNRSTFSRNSARGDGGAIYNDHGELNIADCAFSDNTSASGGGAVRSQAGTAEFLRSRFNANFSAGGGALHVTGGTRVRDCAFTGNGTTGYGDGGGIYAQGVLEVHSSTFSGNVANDGGGIYDYGATLTLTNCTLAANKANTSGGAVKLEGGGRADVTNCTIVGNSMTGNGVFGEFGGGISNANVLLQLRNSIVWGNSASTDADIQGLVTSLGFNLFGAFSPASGALTSSDRVGVNPLLGPLQNNGGHTLTMALLPGSPAINAGTAEGAPAADQRGVARDAQRDIGAYERSASPQARLTVTNPARPVNVRAASFVLSGTAPPGTRVSVYRDHNNNGRIDGPDRLVAQSPVDPFSSTWATRVPLIRGAANNFVVVAMGVAGRVSGPVDVPTIREVTITIAARVRFESGFSFVDVVNVQTGSVLFTRAFPGRVVVSYRDADRDGQTDVVVSWILRGHRITRAFKVPTGAMILP